MLVLWSSICRCGFGCFGVGRYCLDSINWSGVTSITECVGIVCYVCWIYCCGFVVVCWVSDNICDMFVTMFAVRACVRACVHVCVHACMHGYVCVCLLCARVLSSRSHVPLLCFCRFRKTPNPIIKTVNIANSHHGHLHDSSCVAYKGECMFMVYTRTIVC